LTLLIRLNVHVKGLCARGGFVIDIEWKNGELVSATIYSRPGTDCIVRYKDKTIKLNIKKSQEIKLAGYRFKPETIN